MATYEELPSIIKKLKRATIDAAMHQVGWKFNDFEYYMPQAPSSHGTGTPPISRPNADGEGGGQVTGYGASGTDYVAQFNQIRSNIDALVKPWLDLPEPSTMRGELAKIKTAYGDLAVGTSINPSTGTPTIEGSGVLAGHLIDLASDVANLEGDTIRAFKSKFLNRLGFVVGANDAIAYVLAYTLGCEIALFEGARQDVATAFDQARDAMEKLSLSQGSIDWEFVLTVAGWAVAVVGILATDGTVLALAAPWAGLGVDVLKTGAGAAEKAQGSAGSVDSTLQALSGTLGQVNKQLFDAETKIDKCLRDNLTIVLANKNENFDLTDPGIQDVPHDPNSKAIALDPIYVDPITNTYMPAIATELSRIAKAAWDCSFNAIRDASVGIGYQGPAPAWYGLSYPLYELLTDLSTEVTLGAANLKAALADFQHHDAETEAKLKQTYQDLNGPRVYKDPLHATDGPPR